MDTEFQKIYRELIESYRYAIISSETDSEQRKVAMRRLALVSDTIEAELRRLNKPLREDARLFLFVNLHQIIVQPLSHPDSPTELSGETIEDLRADVRTILESAEEESEDRNRDEIAASHVLWGLSKVLDHLNLKSWRIWEKAD